MTAGRGSAAAFCTVRHALFHHMRLVMKNITIQKFADKTAKIGIVGLGYVGLPLMLRYVDIGYQVLGFDIDKTKVDKLNKGETYIEHIPAEKIAAASNSLFEATTDFSRIGEVEAVILCVPTPLNKYREPDMSFVIDTTDAVKPYLAPVKCCLWNPPPTPVRPKKNCCRALKKAA